MNQFVDPEITRIKFEQEYSEFQKLQEDYRKRGVLCLGKSPHSVDFMFIAHHLRPQAILLAVNIDFTNWDVEPPSVTFIDPFTKNFLKGEEISAQLIQVLPNGVNLNLIQGKGDIKPFLCIPGIKEYHSHPAHSGDRWMLYRDQGEGKLCTILEQIYKHSIAIIKNYNFSIQLQAQVQGFVVQLPNQPHMPSNNQPRFK